MADFASGFAAGSKAINDIVDGYYRREYLKEYVDEKRRARKSQEELSARYAQRQRAGQPSTPTTPPAGREPAIQGQAPTPATPPPEAPALAPVAPPAAPGAAPATPPAAAPVEGASAIAPAAAVAPAAEAPGAALGTTGTGVGTAATGAGEAIGTGVGTAATGAGEAIGTGVGTVATGAGEAIGTGVGTVATGAGEAVGTGVGALGTALAEAAPALAALVALRRGGAVPGGLDDTADAATIPGEEARPPAIEAPEAMTPGVAPQATPQAAPPATSAPAAPDDDDDTPQPGLSGAIRGFYRGLTSLLGPREAVATPGSAASQQALARTLQQADPGAIAGAVRRAAEVPADRPLTRMAWNEMNDMLTDHFMRQGDVAGLRNAQLYLETARSNGASRSLSMAVAALESGDMTGGARALSRANEFMPDGHTYSFQPAQNGIQVTMRPDGGGPAETRVLSRDDALAYAHNLTDPEKQRAYLLHARQQEEVERNGVSSRESAAVSRRVALSGEARANAGEARTREDRALEQAWSAADIEVQRVNRDPAATPDQKAAAQDKLDAAAARLRVAQRAGAIGVQGATTTQANTATDRAAGAAATQALVTATQASREAETNPGPEADRAAQAAQVALLESMRGLQLGQASSLQTLMTRVDAAETNRTDRQQISAVLESSAQLTEAQGALQQARTTRDPQTVAAAQERVTAAAAANRRALAGMSPGAATRLNSAITAQEALTRERGGAAGRGEGATFADRTKIEEAAREVLDSLPTDQRSRLSPRQHAAVRDLAVGLHTSGLNRLAPRQAAEVALGLETGAIQVDPNSPVARTPSGQRINLDPETHQRIVAAQQARAATPEPARGNGAAVRGALGGRSTDPRRAAIQQNTVDDADRERRRAAVRARVQQEGQARQRRAAIHDGPGQ